MRRFIPELCGKLCQGLIVKRRMMLLLWGSVITVSVNALGPVKVLPGAVALWRDAETIPVPGVSLKTVVAANDGFPIGWGTFELRAFHDATDRTTQFDLSWPGIFGFVYPGVSVEIQDGKVVPVVYGEVDLFYFPFLIATLLVTERPWFIPSVYMGPRFAPSGVGWNLGIRISIPVPPGGTFDG